MTRGRAFLFGMLLILLWGCAGSNARPTIQDPISLFLEQVQSEHKEEAKQLEAVEPGPDRQEIRLRMRPGWETKPVAAREDEAILLARTWVKTLTQPRGKVIGALAYWFPLEAISLPERAFVRYQDFEGKVLGWAEFRRDQGIFLKWISSP